MAATKPGKTDVPSGLRAEVQRALEALLSKPPYGPKEMVRGGQARLAEVLQIASPRISQLKSGKGGLSLDLADKILRLAKADATSSPSTAGATVLVPAPRGRAMRFLNLERIIQANQPDEMPSEQHRWSASTVAAARAGSVWDDDPWPMEWVTRLDLLEAALKQFRTDAERVSAVMQVHPRRKQS